MQHTNPSSATASPAVSSLPDLPEPGGLCAIHQPNPFPRLTTLAKLFVRRPDQRCGRVGRLMGVAAGFDGWPVEEERWWSAGFGVGEDGGEGGSAGAGGGVCDVAVRRGVGGTVLGPDQRPLGTGECRTGLGRAAHAHRSRKSPGKAKAPRPAEAGRGAK